MQRLLLVILVSAGLLLALGCSVYGVEDSLLLHLSFDDQAAIGHDTSGYDNPVTTHGDPIWVESGICGGAARLDGVDDYFDCGNTESLHLGTDDFTFEAWIKTDTRDADVMIVNTGSYGVGYGCFGLAIRKENILSTDYRCREEDNAIAWRARRPLPTLPPIVNRQPINNGRWHHVVVVADRDYNDGIPRLYRDGTEVTEGSAAAGGSLPASSIVVTNSHPLFVGANSPAPGNYYTGLLDEVKIYRRALSTDEIKSYYQANKIAQQPPTPLPESDIELPEVTELDWQMDEFMISVWGGPTLGDGGDHDAHPQLIKDANIEVVMCRLDKLELCRKWGFKALLFGVSPQQAKNLRNDETVWGYMIKDEPQNYTEYPGLAWSMQELREADPTHPGYINLGGSLQGHHSLYMEIAKPDILSFDYYQWGMGRRWHFPRLEEYRTGALQAGVPLLMWEHPTSGKGYDENDKHLYRYAPDNLQRIRHTIFTSLAYGVKGVQWFHGLHMFVQETELNQAGKDVAEVNAELQNLGPVLVKLHSVDVFHTAALPPATRPIPDDYWVQVAEDDWVLGVFKDPEGNDFLLLANRDHEHENTATLVIRRPGVQVDRLDKDSGEWVGLPTSAGPDKTTARLVATSGDGELLRLR